MGAGVACWLSFCLCPGFLQPPVSGNSILETCSGVLVPYTRHKLDPACNSGRAGGRGPPAPPSLGPVTE